MWKLTNYGKSRLSLPGVKWGDLTDEEYAAAVARHPGMEEQGYFVKEEAAVAEEPHRVHGRGTPVGETARIAVEAFDLKISEPPAEEKPAND